MRGVRPAIPQDGERLLEIWRDAVRATHHFLHPQDFSVIEADVAAFLPAAPVWVLADASGLALGFMVLAGGHMEALFVHPLAHGQGVGRALVAHALKLHPALTTDVNAQNGPAIAFYARMGFVPTGRSPTDAAGRPYPLIHLRYKG